MVEPPQKFNGYENILFLITYNQIQSTRRQVKSTSPVSFLSPPPPEPVTGS